MPSHAGLDRRLSVLKVLASMAVVVVHTSMWRVSQVDSHSVGWWMANLGDAAGRFGSAMFAMVAGAVLLGRPSERAPGQFIMQRLQRLLPAVVIWSVFYFAWREWMWGGLTLSSMWKDVVLGSPWYHLWFMYMMLGMYLVLPVLRYVVLGAGDGGAWCYVVGVAAVLTWCASIAQTLQHLSHASFIGLVPLFVVYLFAGYYFYHRELRVGYWWLLGGMAMAVVLMGLGVAWAYPAMKEWAFILFYSNRSPFAMLLAFALFLWVLRWPTAAIPPWVEPLGRVTLGVYAVHPFWIDMVGHWGWSLAGVGNRWPLIALVVYALSMVTALLLFKMPGMRRLVS